MDAHTLDARQLRMQREAYMEVAYTSANTKTTPFADFARALAANERSMKRCGAKLLVTKEQRHGHGAREGVPDLLEAAEGGSGGKAPRIASHRDRNR